MSAVWPNLSEETVADTQEQRYSIIIVTVTRLMQTLFVDVPRVRENLYL